MKQQPNRYFPTPHRGGNPGVLPVPFRTDRLPQDHRQVGHIPGQRLEQAEHFDEPLARDEMTARLEAALMMSDEPQTIRKLTSIVGFTDAQETKQAIQKLRQLYERGNSAFQIEEIAGGYQLFTLPTYRAWLVRLQRADDGVRLTNAALETLATIAYRQPITRAEVDSIRGVSCGELINQLLEKGFVKISGRQETLGRPVLYVTTKKFLIQFGLNHLDDLKKSS
ncbi:MAG: SMC-Scp complex subunit ScpB [Zavarzinella sp.]